MGDYERSIIVTVAPNRLFGYLKDVTNLPAYLPRMTSASPTRDDKVAVTARIDQPDEPAKQVQGEAWMKVKVAGRTLQWGAPGPSNYQGELDVEAGHEPDTSVLTVRLHTERVEGQQIEDGLDEALRGIAHAAEGS